MTLPTLYLVHGGGPWPWMDGPMREAHAGLARSLASLPALLPEKPRAVLLVTAHWEAPVFTLSAGAAPGMLYDYSGFPDNTYRVRYGSPGAPALAERAASLLRAAGIEAALDTARGIDHGTFVPMFAMYPDADMPVLQCSLRRGLDPAAHLAAGRALAPLRDEGVLIVGSGSSYHNMQTWGPEAFAPSQAFDGWLQQMLVEAEPASRESALTRWEEAPAARHAHPREEHLLPLMVAAGAAPGERGRCIFREERFFGVSTVSSFCFGGTQPVAPWQRPAALEQARRIVRSYQRVTGRELLPWTDDPLALAEALYTAPFVVVSHGTEADPVLNYGTAAALALWETSWEELTRMPSRLTAEAPEREEREQFLAAVARDGFIDDYAGVRISRTGQRFRIRQATVWNVFDERGERCGQAATFARWECL